MSDINDLPEKEEPEIKKGIPILLAVLEFVIAGISFLAVLLFAVTFSFTRNMGGMGLPPGQGILVVMIYLCIAAFFLVMGIGTVKLRSWARNLMLIFSWGFLAGGILAFIYLLFTIPKILAATPGFEGAMGDAVISMTTTILAVMFFFLLIVLPGVFILLYSLKRVKSTFQSLNPEPGVTDRVPLPVLGVTILLWVSALSSLTSLAVGIRFPLFSTILPPLTSRGVWFLMAVLYGYLGLLCYQRNRIGWAGGLLVTLFTALSSMITISRMGIMKMVELMYSGLYEYGYYDFSSMDRGLVVFMIASMAIYAGFFVYISRFYFPWGDKNENGGREEE